MKAFVLLALWLCVAPAWADCPINTGNNASLFLDKEAYQSLHPGDILRVYDGDLCVGKKIISTEDTGLAYPVVVWGNDEITSEVDGATPGNLLRITIEKQSATTLLNTEGVFADNLEYAADRLYNVTSAAFDTTTTRLIAELNADIDRIGAELDTAYVIADFLQAQGDSLQTVVDQQHANITDLQFQLAEANARADSLQIVIDNVPDCAQCESDLAAAQTRIAALEADVLTLNNELVGLRNKLRLIENEALSNKGKYRSILQILYQ